MYYYTFKIDIFLGTKITVKKLSLILLPEKVADNEFEIDGRKKMYFTLIA